MASGRTGLLISARTIDVTKRWIGLVIPGILLGNGASTTVLAQATGPAAGGESLRIHVTAVAGTAQYRPEGEAKWKPLKPDLDLPEGVEFRTGPKGTIQFTVGTDTVYRVDRLTVAKILRASLTPEGTIKTDVGMQYGRVSKDVDAPERPHDDTIVSPSSTLAVRGTRVSLYDQPPYAPEAVSLTGRAVFENAKRQKVAFGAKGEGTAAVTGDKTDPAGNALDKSVVDPSIAYARTDTENAFLANLASRGATVTFDNTLKLPVVRGGTVPTDAETANLIAADFLFVVRWNTNTDINMRLSNSGLTDEFIYPILGLNQTPSGGHILFDHRGGPNGGFEVITYPSVAPRTLDGEYGIGVYNNGPLPTTVTYNAYIDNHDGLGRQPAPFFETDNLGLPIAVNQPTEDVAVGQVGAQLALVNIPIGFGSAPASAAPAAAQGVKPLSQPAKPRPSFVPTSAAAGARPAVYGPMPARSGR
jgi:hypothetical protein